MAEIIEMPLLSDTMTEGVIVAWHKKVGDKVKAGDLLAEIETDKATMELESYFNGVMLHLVGEHGQAITVGDLLCIIGSETDNAEALIKDYKSKKNGAAAPATPEPVAAPEPVLATVSAPAATAAPAATDDRVKASPLAKSVAKHEGVALAEIAGTGDGGRIVKRDVDMFLQQRTAAPAAAPQVAAAATFTGAEGYEDVSLSQMRKTIARRLSESKFGAPHYYLTMEIEMTKTLALRKKLNEEDGVKISVNDFIVKACALGLRKHQKVNASWLGDKVRYYHHIHVGVAVAIEDGLVVPVIRFADGKGLSAIGVEVKALAQKAKDRTLQPEEFQGNTFTISNLGMYGIEQFTAIINPPDACILAVGGIKETPVIVEVEGKKKLRVASMMKVTMSCDHRVVDGAVGSEFLQTVKSLLENPMRMLL